MKESVGGSARAEEGGSHCDGLSLAVHANLDAVLKLARLQPEIPVGETGISASQCMILCEIHRAPGLGINDIARRRAITASTASNLLDKLEARGWVRRERSRSDKRVVQLFITCAGRKALKRFPTKTRGAEISALASIPEEILLALNDHLEAVISRLKRNRVRAGHPQQAVRSRSARFGQR